MKQWEAVEKIMPYLKEDKAVRAVFLKGSLARGEEDSYSDVDLYCLVHKNKIDEFLERRLDYLRKCNQIIFWTEVNFVAPQMVTVFNNSLHFDLYTVTVNTLKQTDEIKVLYDPDNLLSNYRNQGFEYEKEEIIDIFNSFTFSLLEFETAYRRGNMVWATRLASHLSGDLIIIIRYIYDPTQAKLGFKRINNIIPQEFYLKFSKALDMTGPSKHPEGVIKLLDILDELIVEFTRRKGLELNLHFYNHMSARIRELK